MQSQLLSRRDLLGTLVHWGKHRREDSRMMSMQSQLLSRRDLLRTLVH